MDIPPLLTNLRVAEAVRALEANDEAEAARWLTLEHEYAASGAGVVYAALCLWLDKTKIEVPREYRTKAGVLDETLKSRLMLTRGDVMPYRLSIAGFGCGVNTLTGSNILMTRPVSPDLVPQMRGSLARPGQQHPELRWVWLVIENTIEQAKLENNRLAEKFQNDPIMPLANFYERSLQF